MPSHPADVILARPTDTSIVLSVLCDGDAKAIIAYGTQKADLTARTEAKAFKKGEPQEVILEKLKPDTRYYYQLLDTAADKPLMEGSFHTQRAPGSTFVFDIQGDSHPERPFENDPTLYAQTLRAAAADSPDFYIALGDDFSVDTLRTVNAEAVTGRYVYQRPFLAMVAQSAPLFLVNGNHEQAAACNLDGTADNAAVWAQTARNKFFPQPEPDGFYTGDTKPVEHIGLLRDYYAWTWGDALFVVIDPYWHSPQPVDTPLGRGPRTQDRWTITLGDDQYKWLKKTLEASKAQYKFIFTHHVLGSGRGGIEQADLFEWGGRNRRGDREFAQKRPGWDLPIHQLMARNGVTIFFQGHDHVFARQQLDGVVYQTAPEPADPSYGLSEWARDYRSGDVLPNSGRVRVTVAPEKVRVEYMRSFLPKDATKEHPDGEVAFTYEVPAKSAAATAPGSKPAQLGVVAPSAKLVELGKDFKFTEGPAADADGNVYFSDVHASRTYKWSPDDGAKLFREETGSANGLAMDSASNLVACESANGRITSINAKGEVTVIADKYNGKRFNQPNDLWVDPKGGIYFSDPIYGRAENTQGGEHVYYVSPDRKKVTRVIDDMVRPNGLAGTPDGKTLYVADHGAGKTWRYTIKPDGALADKTLFAASGSDGMKLDREGNVYLTTDAVVVYDPAGKEIAKIEVPQQPTNLCFVGKDRKTLFITARTGIYSIQLNVSGPPPPSHSTAPSRPEDK